MWHILVIPFLQAVVPAHLFLVLQNQFFWPVGSVLVLVCADPGPRGVHFYFWRSLEGGSGGVGGADNHVRSYSYGGPVLRKVFSSKEASSDMVLICHAGPRFQTCWPAENLWFRSGEGSPKHTRGERHRLVIL